MKNIGRLLTLLILLVLFASSVSAIELGQKSDTGELGAELVLDGSPPGDDLISNIKLNYISSQSSQTSNDDMYWDWFYHWNLSVNYPLTNQTMIQMSAQNFSFMVYDGFGDDYYFEVNQDSVNNTMPYGIVNIRIPFYYRDRSDVNFAVGLQCMQRYFLLGGSNTIMSSAGQLYVSWNVFEKLAIIGAVGVNYYQVSLDAGEVEESFYGDPGFYYDGEFNEPGTPAYVTGVSEMATSFNVGMKYYLFSGFFIEGSYSYFPGGVINEYNLNIGSYSGSVNLNPITISSDSVFSIGIGIGL